MGCASSKRVEVAVAADVYRPPPTSIALFDISTIQEPWLIAAATADDEENEKQPTHVTHVPLHLLDKLDTYELAPKSWSEVSKALEDLKPALQLAKTAPLLLLPPPAAEEKKQPQPPPPPPYPPPHHQNTHSLHTLQKLDAQLSFARSPPRPPPPELSGFRPVQQNSFLLRDRQERESKESCKRWKRRDPLEEYPERQPPGNPDGVVLYTTTLRGVRRTFEDCELARRAVEGHAVDAGLAVDERDVSLHGEYLKEVRELAGEGAAVPRLFIGGRYVGGAEEVAELSETGKLREMLRWVAGKGGEGGKLGRTGSCEGCGGARFVPCLVCSGSCKVLGEDGKGVVRCGKCNENGLLLCPLCH